MNKKEVSNEYFMDWVQSMLEDCKRVTNIIPEDVLNLAEYSVVDMRTEITMNPGFVTSTHGYNTLSQGTNMRSAQYNMFLSYNKSYFRITNIVNGKSGYSKKLQSDSFNPRIALAVAWARYCKNLIPKTKDYFTNADKIRQMTDEELAEFITSHAQYASDVCQFYDKTKVRRIIKWLKQEVSENDGT